MPVVDGVSLPKAVQPHSIGGMDMLLARIPDKGTSELFSSGLKKEPLKLEPEPLAEEPPLSLQIPSSTKYWRDEHLAWAHHKGRGNIH